MRVQASQLSSCTNSRRVVGCDRGSLEALVEDARTKPESFGVVCGVEDLALDLKLSMWARETKER